jgi:hypothetical protein
MLVKDVLLENIIDNHFQEEYHGEPKNVLKLVHTNIYDPMSTSSNSQNKYFVMFIDDYNRIT